MNEMEENASTSITMMSLEEGTAMLSRRRLSRRSKPLDLSMRIIYGLANENDIVKDNAGNITFAMTTVKIQQFDGTVVKEYHEDGIRVSRVNLKEGSVEMERVKWEDESYVPVNSSHIMNNLQKNEETVSIRADYYGPEGNPDRIGF